ncbi:riboflavin synthase [Haladaptatus sp. CMSO5]|uniref:riboflavin synthase n=1 Tax=Haladaptatus sp. CMSO5 TaxID=3120514 RepID=UPI002FCE1EC4
MFTGIVETTGDVLAVTDTDGGRRLKLGAPFTDLHHGQSISVNGACLTVEEFGDGWFSVFLLTETVSRTAFDAIEEGDVVNLERAMPADGRFDGHIVQGHVDGTAEIRRIDQLGDDWEFEISLPEDSAKYVVEKGSITVDGISLTVASREDDSFTVAIIPTTYDLTNLSEKQVGDRVHLEVDVIAKYVEQLL